MQKNASHIMAVSLVIMTMTMRVGMVVMFIVMMIVAVVSVMMVVCEGLWIVGRDWGIC